MVQNYKLNIGFRFLSLPIAHLAKRCWKLESNCLLNLIGNCLSCTILYLFLLLDALKNDKNLIT